MNETAVKEVKRTQMDYFNILEDAIVGHELESELREFIEGRKAQLAKKRTSMTKTQKENAEIAEKVYEIMATLDEGITVTNLFRMEGIVEAGVKSAQHLTAIIKTLRKEGRVVRTEEKKVAYFSVAKEG